MISEAPPDRGPDDWPDVVESDADGCELLPAEVRASLDGSPLQAPLDAAGRRNPTGGVTVSNSADVSTCFIPVRKPDDGFTFVEVVRFTDSPHAERYGVVWIPEIEEFGAYDGGHYELYVFPGTSWTEIREDPDEYLNAQWGGTTQYRDRKPPGRFFTPELDRPSTSADR